MKRTHTCSDIRKEDVDRTVKLVGWCHSRRDHGGIIFIDLRDRYGLTQVVFDPSDYPEVHKIAENLRREYVIQINGVVRARKEGMENPSLETGEVEVLVNELEILSESETPPMEIDSRVSVSDEQRLRYRYLDLRKPEMQQNMITRHKTVQLVRSVLNEDNFIEMETPILARSTPEGARDYLVPSRVNLGKFYALPQSPQLFKQTIMMSGFDRYYQIAKCFRDEDLRADRQPEFTQIDVEMSFIEEEDIFELCERMLKRIWKEILNVEIPTPFPRMTYSEAIEKYGTDRPDTRFDMKLVSIPQEIVDKCSFEVFKKATGSGGCVKAINAKGCSEFSRKEIDELINYVGIYGAKGLAWMKVQDKLESSIVKFFDEETQREIMDVLEAEKGDLLLFVADHKHAIVNDALANLRVHLGKKLGLIDDTKYNFLWVTDFPMLEYDEDEQKHVAVHHPFTSPKEEELDMLETSPEKVNSRAYDVVLNGTEIGGGSIRIHRKDVQMRVFKTLGIGEEEAKDKFGFLLEALRYGAPPHGGIAFGLDRMIAILTGNESIREVIAFPKNKAAQSLMDGSPGDVKKSQLDELNLKLDMVKQ